MFGKKLSSSQYFLYGSHLSEVQERVLFEIERMGVSVHGNPDLFLHTVSNLAIDDVRMINAFAGSRGVTEQNKICIINFHTAGIEAQNALLKTVEESSCNFFIIAPSFDSITETLRSRMTLVPIEHSQTEREWVQKGVNLIKLSYEERQSLLSDFHAIHDKKKDEEMHKKIRIHGEDIINGIEKCISEESEPLRKKWKGKYNDVYEDCVSMRKLIRIPSSSPKMILDYIVSTIPLT
ncbi:MAG: hypothetical protein ACI9AR_000164 [Flavobacteriaceae bacterium]|jgi:hypothetical protein